MKLGPFAWIQILLVTGKLIDLGKLGELPWFWVFTPVWLTIIILVIGWLLMIPAAIRQRRGPHRFM
jgi:hypothetical protein